MKSLPAENENSLYMMMKRKTWFTIIFYLLILNAWAEEARLLVLGGFNGRQYYSDVYSVSLAGLMRGGKTEWKPEISLPKVIQGHTAVTLGDHVYVLGGFEGFAADRSPIFSHDVFMTKVKKNGIGEWKSSGALPHPLAYHWAVTCGKFLIISGGQSPADVSAVYVSRATRDGTLSDWKKAADLPRAMRGHAAVMFGNRMFILGGHDNRACFDDVFSAEVSEDGRIGEWVHTMPLPRPLIHFGVSEYNGRIYVFGGQDRNWKLRREVYSAAVSASELSSWRRERSFPMPQARMGVTVADGCFVVAGGGYGWDSPVYSKIVCSAVDEDGTIGKWCKTGRLPKPLAFHSVVLVSE